jgi:UDP-hydrolysing UDP-N-acetyl-D-glucosamine 2-epimerase
MSYMTDFNGVTVVSNSRAEDGPLESVIKAMPGCSVTRFNSDGMSPAVAVAQAVIFFTVAFKSQDAKLVVLLGDRYETLAAALAAMFAGIPVAHIHGGETTAGAFDDAIRHSISHMATIHFVATDDFAMKLVNMGIHPYTIKVTGASGLDNIEGNSAKRDKNEILVTYHPETRSPDYGIAQCERMLLALDKYYKDGYDVLFCGVNNDPGSEEIKELIKAYCEQRSCAKVVTDMTHREYVEKMQHAALVVGNSSAGVIEAPWVGVPTINIGDRQKGRPMARSVYSSMMYIDEALKHKEPWKPFYRGGASEKIAVKIKEWLDDAR